MIKIKIMSITSRTHQNMIGDTPADGRLENSDMENINSEQ